MRVAVFCESFCANYVEDLLIGGLRALLGNENVSWWPRKPHLGSKVQPPQAPEASCWIGPPDGGHDDPGTLLSEVANQKFDLVVVSRPFDPATQHVIREAVEVARTHFIPFAGVDGGDVAYPDLLLSLIGDPKRCFVRELHRDDRSGINPFPMCFNPHTLPPPRRWQDRDIDILWGGNNHAGRGPFIEVLKAFKASSRCKVEIVEGRPLLLKDWNDLLSRTKFCVVLNGAGQWTYRHFEAPALGCVPLMQTNDRFCDVSLNGVWFNDEYDFRILLSKYSFDVGLLDSAVLLQNAWRYQSMVARAAELLGKVLGDVR